MQRISAITMRSRPICVLIPWMNLKIFLIQLGLDDLMKKIFAYLWLNLISCGEGLSWASTLKVSLSSLTISPTNFIPFWFSKLPPVLVSKPYNCIWDLGSDFPNHNHNYNVVYIAALHHNNNDVDYIHHYFLLSFFCVVLLWPSFK